MEFRKHFRRFKNLAPTSALAVLLALILLPIARSSDVQPSTLKVKVGDKAPDFALESADGKTVKLSSFTGHNVLIDFYRGYW